MPKETETLDVEDLRLMVTGLAEFIRAGHPDAVAKRGRNALELIKKLNRIIADENIHSITITDF